MTTTRTIGIPLGATLILAGGCSISPSSDGFDGSTPGAIEQDQPGLLYVLQPEDILTQELIDAGFTWLILEPSRTGDSGAEFSTGEIAALRTTGPCGGKIVLSYLSIGEAEDYRDYWDPAWVDQAGEPIPGVAPAWLGPQNPDFAGNYKVRYWDPNWQAIILGTPEGEAATPLDRIISVGFDGVYLDIIDAYEFFSTDDGDNELTRADARERMIEWVRTVSEYAHITRGVDGFLVFPQNGSDIIRTDDDELDDLSDIYFAAIDGIGVEDLFYDATAPQPEEDMQYRLDQLVEYRDRGKTVLVTDYVLDQALAAARSGERTADFYGRTLAAGFIPYAAVEDRDLDEIVILTSESWPVSQPPAECPSRNP